LLYETATSDVFPTIRYGTQIALDTFRKERIVCSSFHVQYTCSLKHNSKYWFHHLSWTSNAVWNTIRVLWM